MPAAAGEDRGFRHTFIERLVAARRTARSGCRCRSGKVAMAGLKFLHADSSIRRPTAAGSLPRKPRHAISTAYQDYRQVGAAYNAVTGVPQLGQQHNRRPRSRW